jgi:hypothetical protein
MSPRRGVCHGTVRLLYDFGVRWVSSDRRGSRFHDRLPPGYWSKISSNQHRSKASTPNPQDHARDGSGRSETSKTEKWRGTTHRLQWRDESYDASTGRRQPKKKERAGEQRRAQRLRRRGPQQLAASPRRQQRVGHAFGADGRFPPHAIIGGQRGFRVVAPPLQAGDAQPSLRTRGGLFGQGPQSFDSPIVVLFAELQLFGSFETLGERTGRGRIGHEQVRSGGVCGYYNRQGWIRVVSGFCQALSNL